MVAACVVALCAAAGGIAGLSWLPQIRIAHIDVSGTESVAPEAVEEEARAALAGTLWGVLARDNILVYPKEGIHARIAAKFPVFKSIQVRRKNLDTLIIAVAEREPQNLWCGPSITFASPCYLVDEDGVAYAPAADFSGTIYTRYYGSTSSATPRQYLTQEQYHALFALIEELKTRALAGSIPSVEVDEQETVNVHFSSGFTLIFALNDSGADVLERLALALTAEPFTSHVVSDFEYLDLRFGDKLYYKLKGEPAP